MSETTLVIAMVIVFGAMGAAVWYIKKKDAARQALMEQPLPPQWRGILEDVRLYRQVPQELKEKLDGMIQVFLAEKRFEGCGFSRYGQEI